MTKITKIRYAKEPSECGSDRYSAENLSKLQEEIRKRPMQFYFDCNCCGKHFKTPKLNEPLCSACKYKTNTSHYELGMVDTFSTNEIYLGFDTSDFDV